MKFYASSSPGFLIPVLTAIAIILTGCINLEPVPESTSFHVLGGLEQIDRVDAVSVMCVRNVELADYLKNSQMVRRTGPNEVQYLSQHRWAGQLDHMIAEVAASEWESSSKGTYATVSLMKDADLYLDLNILRFEDILDGGVAVSLEYKLTDARSDSIISKGRISRISESRTNSVNATLGQLEVNLRSIISDIASSR